MITTSSSRRSSGLGTRLRRAAAGTEPTIVPPTSSPSNDLDRTYVLQNSSVRFIFQQDPITGVKLSSIRHLSDTTTFTNRSRNLWELCVRTSTTIASNPAKDVIVDQDYIRPSASEFTTPSMVPVTDSVGNQYFEFIWDGVKYNSLDATRTCSVKVTATLPFNSEYLEFTTQVYTSQTFSTSDTNPVCVSAVAMPFMCLPLVGTSGDQESDFLSVPVNEGQTILNPHQWLQAPRYASESIQYSETGTKSYFGTSIYGTTPTPDTTRGSLGSPGAASIPLFIYGNRDAQAGFLMYAMDPDGVHAKHLQYYSDGQNLHLRMYDLSDHEVDPYGLGGKDNPLTPNGSQTNTIGWKLRIRPYVSPSIWADWYGAKLYKNETVPELEAVRAAPTSFYNQFLSGDRGIEESEIPVICVIHGHMTGNADDAMSGALYFQDLYTNATSPSQQYKPRILCHFQSVTTNAAPMSASGTGISSNYYGWETWANIYPRGTVSGPTGFRAPDFTGVNSTYSGTWPKMIASGLMPAPYLVFPYVLSSGSVWVQSLSGLDLARKPLQQQDTTLTSSDYSYLASVGIGNDLTRSSMVACSCEEVLPTFAKFTGVARTLAANGAGAYHDALGLWGMGCYANQHQYYNTASQTMVSVSHPRAAFSHHGNKSQLRWLSGFTDSSKSGAIRTWPGTGSKTYSVAQISEYPVDAQLRYVPHYLQTYASTVTSPTFFTPFNQPARSDALGGSLYSSDYTYVSMEAKQWNQTAPLFSIIYGDRSTATDWIGPWISNAVNISGAVFSNIGITGYGSFQEPLIGTATHENRLEQFRNWGSSHLASFGRITALYESSDYSVVNSLWSLSSENMTGVLESPAWSGLTDYTKQMCRMLAYEPDYMYHGTLEHPLEAWSTPVSLDGWGPRALRPSRIHNAGYTSGDDSVMHFAKRHRNGRNVAVGLMNWTSGAKSFTGSFNPDAYEFTSAYNVYRMELASGTHGTKTLLSSLPRGASYTIGTTLPSSQMTMYTFEPSTSLLSEQYLELNVNFVPIRYSYDSTELSKSALTVAYSHGSSCPDTYARPFVGFRSAMTQQMVNNLPQWMKLRQDITSNGWRLVNAWGMNAQSILDYLVDSNSNKFLATADGTLIDRAFYFDIDTKVLTETRNFDNLLFNSSFAMQDACRYDLPAGWTNYLKPNYRNVHICTDKSIVTPYSVAIEGSGTIGQTVELAGVVDKLTSSCYVLADSYSIDVSLLLSVELEDGRNISAQADMTSRSREWRRLTFTTPINAKVYRATLMVKSNSSGTVYIAAPKLEIGQQTTKWSKNDADRLPYVGSSSEFNLIQVYGNNTTNVKIPIFPVSQDIDFIGVNIPTRVLRTIPPTEEVDFQQITIHGRKVSFFNEVFATMWLVYNGYIEQRSTGPSQFDVFGRYSIKDLRYDNQLRYGVSDDCRSTITPVTLTVRDDLLYVVCQEVYDGKTFYSLKIVKPIEPPNGEDYLESVADFRLDLPLDADQYFDQISEQPTSIAVATSDLDWLVINTNLGRRFYFNLYFDYYYYNADKRRVYTLEDYHKAKIQIL